MEGWEFQQQLQVLGKMGRNVPLGKIPNLPQDNVASVLLQRENKMESDRALLVPRQITNFKNIF